jgi:SepF-like predicted cell division protein (DUF552 family)
LGGLTIKNKIFDFKNGKEYKMENTFNNWYEVSIVLEAEHKKIHIVSTESLEEAENKKEELIQAGLKVVVEQWRLDKNTPKPMGEI